MNTSRRSLLFGGLLDGLREARRNAGAPSAGPLRPPGAAPLAEYIELCRDCTSCVTACEPGIIKLHRAPDNPGHPLWDKAVVDVSQRSCQLCADFPCIAACPSGALSADRSPAIGTARVTDSCLTRQHMYCELCRDSCPGDVDALRFGALGRLEIDEAACVGCGECVLRCPLSPAGLRVVVRHAANR